ncbi:MAG: FHA domain-containing protein [Planctomycetota bacterium]
MDAVLVMIKADGSRRSFPLPDGPTTVGRKNTCGLRIPLTSVSRLHCEFRVEGDRLSLRDLGSSNGTLKNGERVQDADLHAGDEVEVGPVRFLVVIDGEPAGGAEPPAGGTESEPEIDADETPAATEAAADSSELSDSDGVLDEDEDDELAAAMASMDDEGDVETIDFGGDPDDSSEFDFTLDDDAEDGDEPAIELLDEDNDQP